MVEITTPIPQILKDKQDILSFLDPTDKLFPCLKVAINNARLKR